MGPVIDNPVILGILVFIIVRVAKIFNWPEQGKERLWLTMGVSVVVAVVEALVGNALIALPSIPPTGWQEPIAFLSFVGDIITVVAANGGIVLTASQLIYHALNQLPGIQDAL